jgi:hypothetical protein
MRTLIIISMIDSTKIIVLYFLSLYPAVIWSGKLGISTWLSTSASLPCVTDAPHCGVSSADREKPEELRATKSRMTLTNESLDFPGTNISPAATDSPFATALPFANLAR